MGGMNQEIEGGEGFGGVWLARTSRRANASKSAELDADGAIAGHSVSGAPATNGGSHSHVPAV